MCGITAYFGSAANGLTRVLAAMSALFYRAPDSTGVGLFGDDKEPIRLRKSLGSVSDLVELLIHDKAYPQPEPEPDEGVASHRLGACLEIPPSKGAVEHMHQVTGPIRGSLAPCGRPAEINPLPARNAHKGPGCEAHAPVPLSPGTPGRPGPIPACVIRCREDLKKLLKKLAVEYDLSPMAIGAIIREAVSKTGPLALEEDPSIDFGNILEAFDRSSELRRILAETPIAIPSDFDSDGVRTVFRLLDSAILTRYPLDPTLREILRQILETLWPESASGIPHEWRALYQAEKSANVYGWAAASAMVCLSRELYSGSGCSGAAPENPPSGMLNAVDLRRLGGMWGRLSSLPIRGRQAGKPAPHTLKSTALSGMLARSLKVRPEEATTDPATLPFLSSPIIAHGRWALQSPVTARNAHPFLDSGGQRAVVLNGQFNGSVEAELRDFLEREAGFSFRSENSTEYLSLLWGYYFDELVRSQKGTDESAPDRAGEGSDRAGEGSAEEKREAPGWGRPVADSPAPADHGSVKGKSLADLDEAAFLMAAGRLVEKGGQLAVAGISIRSPRRLYVASHNRPVFIARRAGSDDFMAVSDVAAALGLFPQELIRRKSAELLHLERHREKTLAELMSLAAGPEAIQESGESFLRKKSAVLESFRVEVLPLYGERLSARIETRVEHGRPCRKVVVTDFEGNPLTGMEPFSVTLSPLRPRKDPGRSFYETHLGEIPERLDEVLRAHVPAQDSPPRLPVREDFLLRRFGPALTSMKRIVFVGMGSAHHVGLMARRFFGNLMPELDILALKPAEVEDISRAIVPETDLAVLLSWSGTTADTVEFARGLKACGASMIALTEKGFSDLALIAGKSAGVIPVLSGEEVTVQAVKSTACMLLCLDLLGLWLAPRLRGERAEAARNARRLLAGVPEKIRTLLADERVSAFSGKIASMSAGSHACFVLDAVHSVGTGLEAALKIEENSWHALGRALDYRDFNIRGLGRDMGQRLVLVSATHEARLGEAMEAMSKLNAGEIPFAAVSYAHGRLDEIERLSGGRCIRLPKTEDALQPLIDLGFYYRFALDFGLAHGRSAGEMPRNRAKSVAAGRSRPEEMIAGRNEGMEVRGLVSSRRDAEARTCTGHAASDRIFDETEWERDASFGWERSFYHAARLLAGKLSREDSLGALLEFRNGSRGKPAEVLSDALSAGKEIVFVCPDRPALASAKTVAARWSRLLGCRMRAVPSADFLGSSPDSSIIFFVASQCPRPDVLSGFTEGPTRPSLWLGPKIPGEAARIFSESAGCFFLREPFSENAHDVLYAALSLILLSAWKETRPAEAAVVEELLRGATRVIEAVLNDRPLKKEIREAMAASRGYSKTFCIGPPIGIGEQWVEQFDQTEGPAAAFHSFGESAHGPLATVDPRVDLKYIRIEPRSRMVALHGEESVSLWEKVYLDGKPVDDFLIHPRSDLTRRPAGAFSVEGDWYLPVPSRHYDTSRDNLILIDGTDERYFDQVLDELATYGCRHARMVVVSQWPFLDADDKRALRGHPVGHFILLPPLAGAGGKEPIPGMLLPFAMSLVGTAMAAASAKARRVAERGE